MQYRKEREVKHMNIEEIFKPVVEHARKMEQTMTEACGAFAESADKASKAFTEVTERAPVACMKGLAEGLVKR